MKPRIIKLRFRAADRGIFEAIRTGGKTVETRAATVKYRDIKVGDTLEFRCGRTGFAKRVKRVRFFRTVAGLTRRYRPRNINPSVNSVKELRAMYDSFPGYREKIRKFGLIALEMGRIDQ